MSEVRHYTGKLVKITKGWANINKEAKRLYGDKALDGWYDDYVEWLEENHYKEYTIINETLYKIKDLEEKDPDNAIYVAKRLNGNDYSFEVKFYDGGQSLDEAVREAVENME